MQQTSAGRKPSDATRARREVRQLIAPFVQGLSAWHQQAARLMLEVDRADSRAEPAALPVQAIQQMIDGVSQDRDRFTQQTASLKSSRVDDVEKSYARLLNDLQQSELRCTGIIARGVIR